MWALCGATPGTRSLPGSLGMHEEPMNMPKAPVAIGRDRVSPAPVPLGSAKQLKASEEAGVSKTFPPSRHLCYLGKAQGKPHMQSTGPLSGEHHRSPSSLNPESGKASSRVRKFDSDTILSLQQQHCFVSGIQSRTALWGHRHTGRPAAHRRATGTQAGHRHAGRPASKDPSTVTGEIPFPPSENGAVTPSS